MKNNLASARNDYEEQAESFRDEIAELKSINANLLAACEGVLEVYDLLTDHGAEPHRAIVLGQKTIQALRNAISKAKGGTR